MSQAWRYVASVKSLNKIKWLIPIKLKNLTRIKIISDAMLLRSWYGLKKVINVIMQNYLKTTILIITCARNFLSPKKRLRLPLYYSTYCQLSCTEHTDELQPIRNKHSIFLLVAAHRSPLDCSWVGSILTK